MLSWFESKHLNMNKKLQRSQQIYIIRKYILASSVKDAVKKDRTVEVHDCWLEENSQKQMVEDMTSKQPIGIRPNK